MIILVGGGSRSGKSRQALEIARACGQRLAFIATAEARDDEMRDRIERHRHDRGPDFTTHEEPLEIVRLLRELDGRFDAIVIDCLTLWLGNLLIDGRSDMDCEFTSLVRTASEAEAAVILVTNEVGCGIVPENPLARKFRDEAGRLNQLAASAATEVFWMAFGIPLRLK